MSMLWTVLKYYVVGVLALIAIEAALVGIALLLCELDAYRDSCRTVTRWEFAGQSARAHPELAEANADEGRCRDALDAALLSRLTAAERDSARYHELRRLLFEDMDGVHALRCLTPSDFDARLDTLAAATPEAIP